MAKPGRRRGLTGKGPEFRFRGVWTMSQSHGEPLKAFENLITQLNSVGSVGKSPLVGLEGTDMGGGTDRMSLNGCQQWS